MKKHFVSFHKGKKPFKCQKCDYRYTKRSKLKKHSQIHEEIKLYNCKFCGFVFTRKSSMKKHVKSVHKKGKGETVVEDLALQAVIEEMDESILLELESVLSNDHVEGEIHNMLKKLNVYLYFL